MMSKKRWEAMLSDYSTQTELSIFKTILNTSSIKLSSMRLKAKTSTPVAVLVSIKLEKNLEKEGSVMSFSLSIFKQVKSTPSK